VFLTIQCHCIVHQPCICLPLEASHYTALWALEYGQVCRPKYIFIQTLCQHPFKLISSQALSCIIIMSRPWKSSTPYQHSLRQQRWPSTSHPMKPFTHGDLRRRLIWQALNQSLMQIFSRWSIFAHSTSFRKPSLYFFCLQSILIISPTLFVCIVILLQGCDKNG